MMVLSGGQMRMLTNTVRAPVLLRLSPAFAMSKTGGNGLLRKLFLLQIPAQSPAELLSCYKQSSSLFPRSSPAMVWTLWHPDPGGMHQFNTRPSGHANPCQYFTTVIVKNFFLTSSPNLPSFSSNPSPLILSHPRKKLPAIPRLVEGWRQGSALSFSPPLSAACSLLLTPHLCPCEQHRAFTQWLLSSLSGSSVPICVGLGRSPRNSFASLFIQF